MGAALARQFRKHRLLHEDGTKSRRHTPDGGETKSSKHGQANEERLTATPRETTSIEMLSYYALNIMHDVAHAPFVVSRDAAKMTIRQVHMSPPFIG